MDPPPRVTPGGKPPESRALTGLRGVGAMLVLAHHVHLHLGIPVPALDGLLHRGYLGVDLFFVLSGFVIALAYGAWFDGARPGRARATLVFLFRRVARLWPLHAAMLIAILALGGWGPQQSFAPRTLIANFAMIQAWGGSTEMNPPAWSISTEFLAYLLFPAIAAPLLRARIGPALGLVAVAALLALCTAMSPPIGGERRGILDIYYNYSLLPVCRCLAGFILGVLTWRAGQSAAVERMFTNAWTAPLALAAAAALLLAHVNDLVIYAVLPLLVLGLHFGTGPACRLFALGPLHRLGVLSYAVYLVHYILLSHFDFDRAPLWIMLPLYLTTTLILAALLNRIVETPGRLMLRRLGNHLLTRAPLAP